MPTILVACSGGQDSIALAAILASLARTGTIDTHIVHVDHAMRETSAEAAVGVEDIARSLGMPFHLVRLETDSIAAHTGVGPEEALRRERYQAIGDVARRIQADAVAVAHHERDQAETVLLHLIRGAGLHGATGMREWTTIDVPWWPSEVFPRALTIWRPFLRESWDEIADVAKETGFTIYQDESNLDRAFRRNVIRHDVVPILERIAPGASANIARFAELAGIDDDLLDHLSESRMQLQPDGDLHRNAIVEQPQAIQRRVIQRWVAHHGFSSDLTTNRIDAIIQLAERNRSGAHVELGAGWVVGCQQGVLTMRSGDVDGCATMRQRERRAGIGSNDD